MLIDQPRPLFTSIRVCPTAFRAFLISVTSRRSRMFGIRSAIVAARECVVTGVRNNVAHKNLSSCVKNLQNCLRGWNRRCSVWLGAHDELRKSWAVMIRAPLAQDTRDLE